MKTATFSSQKPFMYTVCAKEFNFRSANGGAGAKEVVMSPAGFHIEPDLAEYLQSRVNESGMDFWDAYNEEMEARATAAQEAFTAGEMEVLTAFSAMNPPLLDDNEDEECPF